MKKELFSLFAIAILICCCTLPGCHGHDPDTSDREVELTEKNQEKLLAAVPPPRLSDSVERRNLKRRLQTFNKSDKISYIYLVSFGKVMAFYPIKGKVSSVNSLLTTPDQLKCNYSRGHGYYGCGVLPSPDLDGSYGSNGDGIFFFTTEGVYVEWNDKYLLADQPLKMVTPPTLIRELRRPADGKDKKPNKG